VFRPPEVATHYNIRRVFLMANVTKEMLTTHYITVDGEEIAYNKIDNDYYGNPRYVVHFLSLGVKTSDYGKIKGLTKYRAKWYGGGYVIQSYNLETDLRYYLKLVKGYYN
jgi:hypothetical protein